MRVLLADHAGACYGVQRALDIAQKAVEHGESAYTVGPLIHNPGVVGKLDAQGVHVADDLDAVGEGTIIIRSHGVTPEERDAIYAKGQPVVDATCPHVLRAQKAAAELGRSGCRVIVVGEAGHPEVLGLRAYAQAEGATVDVVSSPSDVPDDVQAPVGVVVQTTQRRENLDAIVEHIRQMGIEPKIKDTICFATSQRQQAAAELADEVDAMVVIGGRNSSNTTRLAEICAQRCQRAHHVESCAEIEPCWFEGCETIGVTAGASTPEDQIGEVIAFLEQL